MALQFDTIRAELRLFRKRYQAFLWQQNLESVPFWRRSAIRSLQILSAVLRDIMQEQLSLRAMSLVFTTVIGFFPLFALTFAVMKGLGVHNAMEPTLLNFLQPLGDRAEEFTQQVLSYVDNLQVQLIGVTSVGVLFYFVLNMMSKIESAFNYIWAVKRSRSWASRISEYLFAVIVSPLLLFLSISLTSYVHTNFFEQFLEGLLFGSLIIEYSAVLISFLLMSLAFAFAYGFLPNTKVQFRSAFIGGLVTTAIWKLMGSLFQGLFISPLRDNLYLAFASAIAIMFFIYAGWMVALIGSSIAFYHQNPGKTRSGRDRLELSIAQQEQLSLATALAIISRFNNGGKPMTEDDLAQNLETSPVIIEESLAALQNIGLITKTGDEPARFLPRQAVDHVKLVEIWKALRNRNTDELILNADSNELAVIEKFQLELDQAIEQQLGNRTFSESI